MSKAQTYLDNLADQILQLMEEYGTNWKQPWISNTKFPFNPATKNNYQGINVINLMITQWSNDFASSEWGTYKQWQSIGCQVKAKEKSKAQSVLYDTITKEKNDREVVIPFMKVFPVFNADQVEGYEPVINVDREFTDYQQVEDFVSNTQATVKINGSAAYYNPASDAITMPSKLSFLDTDTGTAEQHYYSTILHEFVHWTGHKDRCDRELITKQRNEDYAKEELVAEFGSAMLCSMLNVTTTPMKDHAEYINQWKKIIKNDSKELKKSISNAQKAVTFLQQYI